MMAWIVSLLLKAGIVLGIANVVPGVKVKSYRSAVAVALVYGFLSVMLGWILKVLAAPLIYLTLGLFLLVINGFLLWMTDKVVDSFDVEGVRPLAVSTVLITAGFLVVDVVIAAIFGG
jgi:putative membrane protein